MARQDLQSVLDDFQNGVRRSRNLANAAQAWLSPTDGPKRPRFTTKHRDLVYELAYLHAFLTWEKFLEESFILYLWGKSSPRNYAPRRFVKPPTREYANQLAREGSEDFIDWNNVSTVQQRAGRFFTNGEPYETALKNRTHHFEKMRIIRNAMVHASSSSQEKFRKVVLRDDLGSGYWGIDVGRYLATTKVGSNPPKSYFDIYMNNIHFASLEIVPVRTSAKAS